MNENLALALREHIEHGNANAVAEALSRMHALDIVETLHDFPFEDRIAILRSLPLEQQAEVFGYLKEDEQVALADLLRRRELARLMTHMSPDERADLFNRLTQEQQDALLPGLAHAEREDIRKLSSYPEGSAGSIMTSDYATLRPEYTAREAIARLRREAPDKETIYDAYVVDDRRRLVGVVSLRDLILARETTPISNIMRTDVIIAHVETPREEAARKIAQYDLLALPIVNGGDALVGIITQDDAMDVQEQEAALDLHKVASLGEVVSDVGRASIWHLYRLRIVWLVVLVFGNIFSGAGIAAFEDTIQAYVALVFFLPLLIDSGGNAGSQAATLMVRGLATGEVILKDWGRMIGREVGVAGLLGLTMALAVSVLGIVRGGPEIALVVSASMVIIVLVGSTIGMSLPFILSRWKLDPATASAPLVTSIADAAGVLIYFAIATTFLPMPGVAS